jgi:hypothetical protein
VRPSPESFWGKGRAVADRQNTRVPPHEYTLRSNQLGMCEDLLLDADYDLAGREDLLDEMALAADLAAVDAAYEVMREHGLKTLADREREQLSEVPRA